MKNIDVKEDRNSKLLTEKLKKLIPEEDAEGKDSLVILHDVPWWY